MKVRATSKKCLAASFLRGRAPGLKSLRDRCAVKAEWLRPGCDHQLHVLAVAGHHGDRAISRGSPTSLALILRHMDQW